MSRADWGTEWVEYFGGPWDGEMREEPAGLFLVGVRDDPALDARGYYNYGGLADADLDIVRMVWGRKDGRVFR
jgi:hypothetical protein